MRELSLFSGAGGGLLGTKLLGWRAVGYVERDGYCQAVLEARIRDGLLDSAPIFGDIRDFLADGWADRYRGLVDVVTAGFPCQPFSVAGKRRACGDERNLWPETAEVLERVQPAFALLENVPGLLTARSADGRHYFGTVLGDLAALGFNAEWCCRGADDVGAPHLRKRLWILAHSERAGLEERREPEGLWECAAAVGGGDVADAARDLRPEREAGGAEWERAWAGGEPLADADPERRLECWLPEGQERQCVSDATGGSRFGADPGREGDCGENVDNANGARRREPRAWAGDCEASGAAGCGSWWLHDPADEGPESESFLGRVAHGVAHRVDRLRALGNGQVPAVVVRAWRELAGRAGVLT